MSEAGYGVETWCLKGLASGRYARGRQVVAQAIYRRLTTSRGTLRGGDEESAYGIDLSEYLGATGAATAVAALPSIVRGELLKDDRIVDVSCTVTSATEANGDVDLTLVIVAVLTDEDEPLELTLLVDDVTVQVLRVAA